MIFSHQLTILKIILKKSMGAAVTNVTQNNKKSDIKSDDARSNETVNKVNI